MTKLFTTEKIFCALLASALLACGEEEKYTKPAERSSEILVTIKPLHSIVTAVIGDTAPAPGLLIDGARSPHGFSLTPADAMKIANADLVFYIDDHFESFLSKSLNDSPQKSAPVASAVAAKRPLYKVRYGHHHDEAHGHEHEREKNHRESRATDYHLWLSPAYVGVISTVVAEKLTALHPENKEIYEQNAKKFQAGLQALHEEIKKELEPVKEKKFMVFHDAFQYFEKTYGLQNIGAIAFDPTESAAAAHLAELREKLEKNNVRCIFREPQFSDRAVQTVIEGSAARTATLDEIGAAVTATGTEGYSQHLRNLAKAYRDCLGD